MPQKSLLDKEDRMKNMIFYLLTKLRSKEISVAEIMTKLDLFASTGFSLQELAIKLDLLNSTAVAIEKIANKLNLFSLPRLSVKEIIAKLNLLINQNLSNEQIVEKLGIPAFIGLSTEEITTKLNKLATPGLSVEYIASQLGIPAWISFSYEQIVEKLNTFTSRGWSTEKIAEELGILNGTELSIEQIVKKITLIFSTTLSIHQLTTKIDLSIAPLLSIANFVKKLKEFTKELSIEKIAEELGVSVLSRNLSTDEIITKLALLEAPVLSLEEIGKKLGVSHTTVTKYRNILWNSPIEWKNFFPIGTVTTKNSPTVHSTAQFNEINHYIYAINKIGLGKTTLWNSLDSKSRKIYVDLRKREGKTVSDISLQLGEKESSVQTMYNGQAYPEEVYLTYSNAEKEFKKRYSENNSSIEIPMWKVKWASLNRKEQILHILLRKNVGMNPEQIATSLEIEDPEILTKYFPILEYASLNEIEEFWQENSSISIDMLYQKTEILQRKQNEKLKTLLQEAISTYQAPPFVNNKEEELWNPDKRIINMNLILSQSFQGTHFNKPNPLGKSGTTIYNYLAILKRPKEVQRAFFNNLISVDEAIKYPQYDSYEVEVNNNTILESKPLWDKLTNEGKRIYILARAKMPINILATNLGVTSKEIKEFLDSPQGVLNNEQKNIPPCELETLIPIKPGEWNKLKREELKMFHILSRWFKRMTNKQIAESLNIPLEVVKEYFLKAKWEPKKIKEYLDEDNSINTLTLQQQKWHISSVEHDWVSFQEKSALENQTVLVNQGASTSHDNTTVLLNDSTKQNENTIVKQSNWKEKLTPSQLTQLAWLEYNPSSDLQSPSDPLFSSVENNVSLIPTEKTSTLCFPTIHDSEDFESERSNKRRKSEDYEDEYRSLTTPPPTDDYSLETIFPTVTNEPTPIPIVQENDYLTIEQSSFFQ